MGQLWDAALKFNITSLQMVQLLIYLHLILFAHALHCWCLILTSSDSLKSSPYCFFLTFLTSECRHSLMANFFTTCVVMLSPCCKISSLHSRPGFHSWCQILSRYALSICQSGCLNLIKYIPNVILAVWFPTLFCYLAYQYLSYITMYTKHNIL
jgi:hypothetical protein